MRPESQNHFHAVRKSKVPREIVAQIRDMIAIGNLKAGDRLPPERDLAQSFGVGRCALREAVRVLESLGLVDVRPGEGTFLREDEAARTSEQHSFGFLSTLSTQRNLVEVGRLLVPGLAGLAARRATADDLVKLRGVIEAQAAKVERGESGADEDLTFHRLIAEAAGNPVLVQLMRDLTRALQESRDTSLQHNGHPVRSLRQNRAILAAIESRNPTLAARRMEARIRNLQCTFDAAGLPQATVSQSTEKHAERTPSQGMAPFFSPVPISRRHARTALNARPA
jgi:GntR family transcriptional regulator, transcriptional repressor for pyruvate dehydrogenase complex